MAKRAPLMTREYRRKVVAVHEAAHAVAMVRFGFGCERVSIRPDRAHGTLGRASGIDHWGQPGDDPATRAHNNLEARHFIVMCIAGYAATLRVDLPDAEARYGARRDFENTDHVLPLVGWSIEDGIREAKAFVAKNWKAIDLVAEELVQHTDLECFEVQIIVEVADGKSTAVDLAQYRANRDAAMSREGGA